MIENPYNNLYFKLKTAVENPQAEFMRKRFLMIFMEVVQTCPEMDFSALNLFSLQELNVVRIALKRDKFNREFLQYFTRKKFLRNAKHLDYFISRVESRGRRVKLTSKMMRHQYPRILTAVLIKLKTLRRRGAAYRKARRWDKILRMFLRDTGLAGYTRWCINTGKKFTNRSEVDFSETYCLKTVTE